MYESGEMVIFGQLFREVAEKETRVVTPLDDSKLGREAYALVDLYCVAPDCDCRRVMINVIRDRDTKHLATVNWAFNPNDPDRGPFLDPLNVQSEVASKLLGLVKEQLADRRYVERLERHYRMVKEAVADPRHAVHRQLTEVTRSGKGGGAKMSRYVAALTDEELRDHWLQVGLDVPRELVDETLKRGGRMLPHLGAFLVNQELWETEGDESWAPVHSLFLLQALKDPAATPYVVEALRRGLGMDWLTEDGDQLVFALGKGAIEPIWEVAQDPKSGVYGRATALDGLTMFGLADGEVRRDLRDRFRALARTVLDSAPEAESNESFLLSTLLECLACLHDEEARPLLERAFKDKRLDFDPPDKAEILRLYEEPFEKILGDLNLDPRLHFDPEELDRYKGEEDTPSPVVRVEQKIGRNDPCPCGSGKKYKKCCLSG
jgi:hypothetical protein